MTTYRLTHWKSRPDDPDERMDLVTTDAYMPTERAAFHWAIYSGLQSKSDSVLLESGMDEQGMMRKLRVAVRRTLSRWRA